MSCFPLCVKTAYLQENVNKKPNKTNKTNKSFLTCVVEFRINAKKKN